MAQRAALTAHRDGVGAGRQRLGQDDAQALLAHGDRSPALSQAWPDLKRQLAH